MEWTRQKLAAYLGQVRTVVEFRGITGEELERAFQGEAMIRLRAIEQLVDEEELSDEDKLVAIRKLFT